MNCSHCGGENPTKADYCRSCGEKFTDKEKKAAYGKTVYGKIDRFLELKSWVTLGKITGHPIFRAAVLLILAVLVVVNVGAFGRELCIKNSGSYDVAFNGEMNEYYVMTDLPEVSLSVYVPRKTSSLVLNVYRNEVLSESRSFDPGDGVTVQISSDCRYEIAAAYEKGGGETLSFFVCEKEAAK